MINTYIIISTLGIGGAEKRFVELWLNIQRLNKNNSIKLVLPYLTYKEIIQIKQFSDFNEYNNNFITYELESTKYFEKRRILLNLLNTLDKENSIFHFIMGYPVFFNFLKNYNVLFTHTSTSFKQLNINGLVVMFLSIFEAKRVDVLDPQITKTLKRIFFWNKNNIHNTPSSFIDLNYYQKEKFINKKNWLVFLGRFEEVKQVKEFVSTIPIINEQLKKNNINNSVFYILGTGSLENELRELITKNEFININIKIYFEKEPLDILRYSKIFFSLQKYSNYPSKSLLEAMACGNLPIVTDNRDTRKIANEDFSYYVNEAFSPEELSMRCVEVLSLDADVYENKVNKAILFMKKKFSINTNINYFYNLYTFNKK